MFDLRDVTLQHGQKYLWRRRITVTVERLEEREERVPFAPCSAACGREAVEKSH